MSRLIRLLSLLLVATPPAFALEVSGKLQAWHKVTVSVEGPFAREMDTAPNPFTDYRMTARFEHELGSPTYEVPGYFAADGRAAESGASEGSTWKAHLSPDKPGRWKVSVTIDKGPGIALKDEAGENVLSESGEFKVDPSNKSGRDFRSEGRLQYVGEHHLRFAGSGRYFLKAGADAPETLLGYADFDGTSARKPAKCPLKTWEPHLKDWEKGDPTWQGDKGKGLIGALNYLSSTGCNVFSFLTYNAGGDGDNVWPFAGYGKKLHYDCSKLDQWGITFDHATTRGLYLHFKLQETENDDLKHGQKKENGKVPAALDGGELGPERKLYLREMIARYGHALALNWNLGEENTQSTAQQKDMAEWIEKLDPYNHLIVIHTYPNQQDKIYGALLGEQSKVTGASLQNSNVKDCHRHTLKWVTRSREAGKPWVVAFDEPGSASFGTPPDPGYPGTPENFDDPSVDQVRKQALWGTLMAGGAGIEYYFGYKLPQNDLICEDWRSRALTWKYSAIALEFFKREEIPFWNMTTRNDLVANPGNTNERYCLALPGEIYLVYLPKGGNCTLELGEFGEKAFSVSWLNPRTGELSEGKGVLAEGKITAPSGDDWLAMVKSKR